MLIIGCDFHTRYQQIGGWHTLSFISLLAATRIRATGQGYHCVRSQRAKRGRASGGAPSFAQRSVGISGSVFKPKNPGGYDGRERADRGQVAAFESLRQGEQRERPHPSPLRLSFTAPTG